MRRLGCAGGVRLGDDDGGARGGNRSEGGRDGADNALRFRKVNRIEIYILFCSNLYLIGEGGGGEERAKGTLN